MLTLLLMLFALASFTQTVITRSGTITTSETWSADTIKVTGDITIPDGITLSINPGTYVEVQGYYRINIQGRILAQGTANNRITFTAKDSVLTSNTGGWNGLKLKSIAVTNDSSKIEYCTFKYGNSYGPLWDDRFGGAILMFRASKVRVTNNFITKNRMAELSTIDISESSPLVAGNVIVDNNSQGILCSTGSSAKLFNNTIANNTKKGLVNYQSNPTVTNCIIYGNSSNLENTGSSPVITYCNIGNATVSGTGNINQDPKFIGTGKAPYGLLANSPCINTGDPSHSLSNVFYEYDIIGNTRIYIKNTDNKIDMGAYEFNPDLTSYIATPIKSEFYAKAGSPFELDLDILSYPSSYTVSLNNAPTGMTVVNDTIRWTPSDSHTNKSFSVSIIINNGNEIKTKNITLIVLDINSYGELPDEDIIWDADTIKVIGNLTLNNTRTLTIKPGVVVQFLGHYSLNIQGRLLAKGTKTDTITFISKDKTLTKTSGGWNGIRFDNTASTNDSTIIQYVKFSYGNAYTNNDENSYSNIDGGAIYINNSRKIRISDCLFEKNKCLISFGNGSGIYVRLSKTKITNNTFKNNYSDYGGSGIYCLQDTSYVFNNRFYLNESRVGGCAIGLNSSRALVVNNVLYNNTSSRLDVDGAIFIDGSNDTLINNTIANNTGNGICIRGNSYSPVITNCLSANNTLNTSSTNFKNGGSPIISNSYLNIVDANELFDHGFVDLGNNNFQLKGTSPFINKGKASTVFNNHNITTDCDGNSRIAHGTIDIGAFEYHGPEFVFVDKTCKINENPNNDILIDSVQVHYYGNSGTPTLKLLSGNEDNSITFNYVTGMLWVNDSTKFNYELNDSLVFKFATSVDTYKDTALLIVKLNDINDPPTAPVYVEIKIEENQKLNAVIDTIKVFDEDGNDELVYSFKYDNNAVGIVNSTGVLYVKDPNAFDFEKYSQYLLPEIIVSDGEYEVNIIPEIILIDLNEAPTIQSFTANINENTPNGSLIEHLNIFDSDNDTLTLEIISGNTNDAFIINNTDTTLRVNNSDALNFEETPVFNLKITVSDGELTDTANITINLKNLHGINPLQGSGRSNAVSFTINDTVYIGLGNNADTVLNDFWSYNSTDDIWKKIASFPGKARAGAVAFVINGKAYVGSGYNGGYQADSYFNDFYEYNPITNTWTKIADFAGVARHNAVAFAIGDTAYMGTGLASNGSTKDFWKYSPSANVWTALNGFPGYERTSAVAFVVKGKGYISGGVDINDSGTRVISDVQEYDPLTGLWTEKIFADGLNLTFNSATAIAAGDKAFICYGNFKKVVSYQPSTNNVEDLGDILNLGEDRSYPISFMLNDTAYFGLGYYYENTWDEVYSNEIVAIDLPISFAPSDITLSVNTIEENQPTNTLVGTITASDRNTADTHTFELASGSGDTDNSLFSITDNKLLATPLNFEEKETYSIRIKANDNDGNTFEKALEVIVLNVNDAPSDIVLGINTYAENNTIGDIALKSNLATSDGDMNDKHTYTFTAGTNDNESFSIDNGYIYPNTVFNYEYKNTYAIEVTSTDSSGASITKSFDIYIENVNEKPDSVTISNNAAYTSDNIGTIVGTFIALDVDQDDTHTFEFTSNDKTSIDDAKFYTIDAYNLVVNAPITTEKAFHELLIKVTDAGGLDTTSVLAIIVEEGVGIKLLQEASTVFKIYPNPTNGLLNIEQLNTNVNIKQIKLKDSNGGMIKSVDGVSGFNQLNLSEYKAGIYFIVLETNDKLYYKKVILE